MMTQRGMIGLPWRHGFTGYCDAMLPRDCLQPNHFDGNWVQWENDPDDAVECGDRDL